MSAPQRYTLEDAGREIIGSNIRRASGACNLEDLTTMLWQMLRVTRPELSFVPAYPPYLVDVSLRGESSDLDQPQIPDEVITWLVVRKVPGSISKERFGDTKEWKPRLREELLADLSEEVTEGEYQRKGIQTYGQIFEYILQFDCWAKTNFESERLAAWFEHVMKLAVPALMAQGVQMIHFWARIKDALLHRFPGGIIARSLQYYVRLEEVTPVTVNLIRQINLTLRIQTGGETPGLDVDLLRSDLDLTAPKFKVN